jgi:DNA primase
MFPIRDDRGRVAGFGGRLLPGDALGAGAGAGSVQPKYVNTPQSPIFDKGAVLYGLHLAKEAIRQEERAVIVEGYMDAIAAHEHGFANVVASMGTALTERQVGLLKRYTRNLVLALDADAAGGLATERGEEVIASAVGTDVVPVPDPRGIVRMQNVVAADIRVVSMPEGRDPDEVIRSDGAGWEDMVAQAKPVLDYLFDAVAAKHDLTSPRERSAVAADLLPMIGDIADNVVQSHYLQRLARLAQVDEATLRSGMRRGGRARRAREPEGVAQGAAPQREASRARKEEVCLAMLFRYPELRAEGAAIDADIFGQGENRALFETWIEWPDEGEPFERSLTPDLLPQYERLASLSLPAYDDRELVRALQSTVWGIEQQRLRTAKRVSAAALADLVSPADAQVAERAYTSWRAGATAATDTAVDEADPAAAFVDDMEVGLKVHQRLLDQRKAERPAR